LNCRHEDFQSSALPTELPGQIGCACRTWSLTPANSKRVLNRD